MRYDVSVVKKFQYVRVYHIVKKIKGDTNAASKFVLKLINKYIVKKPDDELEGQETP